MQWAGDLWLAAGGAGESAREHHLIVVRAAILHRIPFVAVKVEDRDLQVVVLDADAESFGEVGFVAGGDPGGCVHCSGHYIIVCLGSGAGPSAPIVKFSP